MKKLSCDNNLKLDLAVPFSHFKHKGFLKLWHFEYFGLRNKQTYFKELLIPCNENDLSQ